MILYYEFPEMILYLQTSVHQQQRQQQQRQQQQRQYRSIVKIYNAFTFSNVK